VNALAAACSLAALAFVGRDSIAAASLAFAFAAVLCLALGAKR
jgi:hypothetical protein